ncbi:MAG: hypothetical protein ACLTC8_06085 [Lachnospiraceae bacterium]
MEILCKWSCLTLICIAAFHIDRCDVSGLLVAIIRINAEHRGRRTIASSVAAFYVDVIPRNTVGASADDAYILQFSIAAWVTLLQLQVLELTVELMFQK